MNRRLEILATNYGRNAGWFVELNDRRVAILTDPEFFDMFWESYHVTPLTTDATESQRILTDRKWWLENRLVFRNRKFDEIADLAFPAGDVFTESGRIIMRGLYLVIDPPNLWERIRLFLRRNVLRREE
jgi:hypothetical protein